MIGLPSNLELVQAAPVCDTFGQVIISCSQIEVLRSQHFYSVDSTISARL